MREETRKRGDGRGGEPSRAACFARSNRRACSQAKCSSDVVVRGIASHTWGLGLNPPGEANNKNPLNGFRTNYERFFFGYSVFPFSSTPNMSTFQLTPERQTKNCTVDGCATVIISLFVFYRYLFIPILYLTRLIFRKKHFPNFQGMKAIFHGAIRNARKPVSHNSASLM